MKLKKINKEVPKSGLLAFYETTNEPFGKTHTVFAPRAPDDKNKK